MAEVPPAVRQAIEASVGARIRASRPVSGGDINDAFELDLTDGRRVFVKTSARLPARAFEGEALGLAWLAEARAVAVPEVLAVSHEGPGYLVLQAITARSPRPSTEEALGRSLAALHRFGAPTFGLDRSNWLATLPQDNTPEADWPTFYRCRRLEPLIERAAARGLVGTALREIDLAMMRLFGGFGSRVFGAYAEAYPLAPGSEERVGLYQLYPLLAHVVMFGGGYVGQLTTALDSCL